MIQSFGSPVYSPGWARKATYKNKEKEIAIYQIINWDYWLEAVSQFVAWLELLIFNYNAK